MLGLPQSTEFNKRIPKQKFYEHLSVTPALRRIFVNRIRAVYWRNKLAPSTVNLAGGGMVTELEVFEIQLSERGLEEMVLRQIDQVIPYHILFVLTCEDSAQLWIGFKQTGPSAKVLRYFHTDWMMMESHALRLEAQSMDGVYESWIRQIGGVECSEWSAQLSIAENITRDDRRRKLQKQIDALQAKIRKEKQLNRQMEIKRKLREQMEALNDLNV